MPKFYARVPVRGHVWLVVEAASRYDAEAEALLGAARLQDKDLDIAVGVLKLTTSPAGEVDLAPHEDDDAD